MLSGSPVSMLRQRMPGREQLVEARQQIVARDDADLQLPRRARLRGDVEHGRAHATGFTPPAFAITFTPRSATAGSTLSIAPMKSRA